MASGARFNSENWRAGHFKEQIATWMTIGERKSKRGNDQKEKSKE
jgi:hypothetical protein